MFCYCLKCFGGGREGGREGGCSKNTEYSNRIKCLGIYHNAGRDMETCLPLARVPVSIPRRTDSFCPSGRIPGSGPGRSSSLCIGGLRG